MYCGQLTVIIKRNYGGAERYRRKGPPLLLMNLDKSEIDGFHLKNMHSAFSRRYFLILLLKCNLFTLHLIRKSARSSHLHLKK